MALPYDAILSTTLLAYKSKLEDNVFKKTALLDFLTKHCQTEEGGAAIVRPIIHGTNTNVMSYTKWDPLTFAGSFDTSVEVDPKFSMAEYKWRQMAGAIAINGLEEAQNNGERAFINLVKAKIQHLEDSFASDWNAQFFADPASGSKNFTGLAAIVSTVDPTREGSAGLGKIPVADFTDWKSKVEATVEALSLTKLSKNFNDCSQGRAGDHPTLAITTQSLWEKYETLLQPQLRYTDAKMADAGFQNLVFKGIPVVWDVDCQANVWYHLNPKYLYLVKHTGTWMKPSPFIHREDKDVRYSKILSYGELICVNRSKLGKLTGKS